MGCSDAFSSLAPLAQLVGGDALKMRTVPVQIRGGVHHLFPAIFGADMALNDFIAAHMLATLDAPPVRPASTRASLQHHEAVIEQGLKSFFEVGQALAAILDERLYKDEFGTFEEYCRQRWDLNRSYAYELIESSRIVGALSKIANAHLPANPGQARALFRLEPGEAHEVMRAAHEATGGKITARAIREARKQFAGVDNPIGELRANVEQQQVAHLHVNARKVRELLDEYLQVPHFAFTDDNFQRVTALLVEVQAKANRIEKIYHAQRSCGKQM
jgi:hypothetical protein